MINEKVFLGFPIDFKDICKIYPPTVNDVCGNPDFPIYRGLLTITQDELEEAYAENQEITKYPTPFQYLMMNYHQDEEMREKILECFQYFLHEPVTIVPELEMLLVGKSEEELDPDVDLEEPRLISADDYFDFQNMVRMSMGDDEIKPPEPEDPNLDPRIKRYKEKIKQSERLLARKKRKKGNAPTLGTLLAAICCMGIGLNPLNIGEMSYACVHWLISMEQQKEEYDIDIRALLAGADSKKVKPKYWIKNIDEKEL